MYEGIYNRTAAEYLVYKLSQTTSSGVNKLPRTLLLRYPVPNVLASSMPYTKALNRWLRLARVSIIMDSDHLDKLIVDHPHHGVNKYQI
jgi:hypothetical protein